MRKTLLALAIALVLPIAGWAKKPKKITMSKDAFISGLMSRMTIEEKIGQLNLLDAGQLNTGVGKKGVEDQAILNGEVGGFLSLMGVDRIREVQQYAVEHSRLGIPLLFGLDVIHGYHTIFPIPLALSCTWDMEMIERTARVAAIEATADGIPWVYSPMVDISRDARWGRIAESAGEDPFLGSAIARAMVMGYQGDKRQGGRYATDEVMACVKHFALYGAAESGLDYNVTDMSRVRMYNDYLAPYRAAVEAGVGSVMSSFNTIDYEPATSSCWLLTDLLREQWNFKGFVVTDYGSIGEMQAWGCGDLQECSTRALSAGTDFDMCSRGFVGTLKKSLDEGRITENQIDIACRRMLEAKWDLGLFDDPYRYCQYTSKTQKPLLYTDESRALARRIAAESFVLLKNDNNLLPLKKKGKIALVGPMAHAPNNMRGCWAPTANSNPNPFSTLLESLRRAVGEQAEIKYAKGSNIHADAQIEANWEVFGTDIRDPRSEAELLGEALETVADADVIVAAIGESQEMTGESTSRSDIGLPETQMRLLQAMKATGKPVVVVYFTGRPVVMKWEKENIPAILNVWFGGSEGGDAICDVLFGDASPSGKLTTSFPQATGQEPFYYNHMVTGRPTNKWFSKYATNYTDIDGSAVFPFGYGMTYTTFAYGALSLSSDRLARGGKIQARVTVTNTGQREGDEVVQMYIHDTAASIARPVMELKGFERIHLAAGESKTVTFDIDEELLKFYNVELRHVAEPGEFTVMVGPHSQEVQSKTFVLE
ncbi:MAG: beta-glucosidase BglX [Prevotella sp.]|nr:beta-glucosidase BglX [Prevotella sp.]